MEDRVEMNCGDTCCNPNRDEGNNAIVLKDRTIRARKEHVCTCCRKESIHKGDLYHYRFVIIDGESWVEKTCLDCESLEVLVW